MGSEEQKEALGSSRLILVPRAHLVNKDRLFQFIRQNSVTLPPNRQQQPLTGPVLQQSNLFQRSQSLRPAQKPQHQFPPANHNQLNRNVSFRSPPITQSFDRFRPHNHSFQPQSPPPPPPSQPVPFIQSPLPPPPVQPYYQEVHPQVPQQFPSNNNVPYRDPMTEHFAQHVRNINSPQKGNNGGNSFLFSGNFDPNRRPVNQVTAAVPLFGDNLNNRKRNNDDMFSPPPRKMPTPSRNQSSAAAPVVGGRDSPSRTNSNQRQDKSIIRNPLASASNLPTLREDARNRQFDNEPSRKVYFGGDNEYEDGSIFVGNKVNDAVASSMLGRNKSRRAVRNSLDGIEHNINFSQNELFEDEEDEEDDMTNDQGFFREQTVEWMTGNVLSGQGPLDGLGGHMGEQAGGALGAKLGKKLGNEKAGEMIGEFAGEQMGDMAEDLAKDAAMDALGEMGAELPEGVPEVPDVGIPKNLEKPDMNKLCKGCSIM